MHTNEEEAGNEISSVRAATHGFLSDLSETPERLTEAFETPSVSSDESASVDGFSGYFGSTTTGAGDEHGDGEEQDVFHELELDLGALFLPSARKEAIAEVRDRLRRKLREQLTPQRVMLRDKWTFTLGSMDLFFSAYWLGSSPSTFYKLYSVKVVVMLLLRFVHYRSTKQHYYMLDLCYWVQALLLLHLWVYPLSVTLAKMVFALSLGPLLWSILAFRNSLVYHSFDKVTSLFLHWFPACVCWAHRWHPPESLLLALEKESYLREKWDTASFKELCVIPILPYLAWAVLYYLKIFVVSQKRISERKYATLFNYVTSRKGIFAYVVLKFPRRLQPLAYLSLHCALTTAVMALNVFWWGHEIACTALIVAALALASWNGASFYFNVFARRYMASLGLEQHRPKHAKGSNAPESELSSPAHED